MNWYLKTFLIGVLVFFLMHLLRDMLQDLKMDSFLTTSFVKTDTSKVPNWYWQLFNTYMLEIVGIILSSFSLIYNRFKPLGLFATLIFVLFITVWLYYWLIF